MLVPLLMVISPLGHGPLREGTPSRPSLGPKGLVLGTLLPAHPATTMSTWNWHPAGAGVGGAHGPRPRGLLEVSLLPARLEPWGRPTSTLGKEVLADSPPMSKGAVVCVCVTEQPAGDLMASASLCL